MKDATGNPEELSDDDLAAQFAAARERLNALSQESAKRDKAKRDTLQAYLNEQKVQHERCVMRVNVLKKRVLEGAYVSFDTDAVNYFICTGEWPK